LSSMSMSSKLLTTKTRRKGVMAGGESLSGKMRLKGKCGKWSEMERFEWKVESGDLLFLCCRVLFIFFGGCQVLG